MSLCVLVINLEGSTDRWKAISDGAAGIELRRIEAVNGRKLEDRPCLARMRFELSHGRTVLAGEYGCYLSHLRALQSVVDENLPAAIIAEDDIVLDPELPVRAQSLLDAIGDGVIKLVHHRATGFRRRGTSAAGDEYGRCIHGPQGSAACYAVTNAAARRLLATTCVMWLPWDVALERGWDTGTPTFTVRRPLVEFSEFRATSTLTNSYRHSRLAWWRLFSVLAFRAEDYLRRMFYARSKT